MKRLAAIVLTAGIALTIGCSKNRGSVRHETNQSRVVTSHAPAHSVNEPSPPVRKAPHVHGRTCGCAWDRRERVWVILEDGHVHGRNCGHININGKWCLAR